MADHYTVLARRFRPQTFDDVVGQEHVGRAIQNAIKAGRVAHAYLFTGARGVGKTSTARIFAKALNCPNVQAGVPCNDCEVCNAIGNGADVDVLEIDGASNRGIDDIRQLRANVNIRSMRSPFKVYIIDEVHMLTKEAFNALLKTLEEPPPNVKFIFCTTEPQKVPDTILSRCQRFDFGTITSDRIGDRLKEIAAAEGVSVDDEAVAMVARRAAGSMRDSQSLFDQLLAFGGESITSEDVHRLFGTAPDERIVELMDAIIQRDRATAISMVDTALNSGVRLDSLTDQIVAYQRDLMVLAAGATNVPLTSVGDRLREQLAEQANAWGLRSASAALQIVADAKLKMSRTVHGRPLLELAVVRLSLLEDLDGLAALVQAARSGKLPDLPMTVVSGGRTAIPSHPAETKKKTVVESAVVVPETAQRPTAMVSPTSPQPSSGSVVSDRVTAADDVESTDDRSSRGPAVIRLSPETFDDFWYRLTRIVPERLGNALNDAKSKTLLPDGRVEVVVGTGFALSFLESSATQKRLASLTAEMTGSTVVFVFKVDPNQTAHPATVQHRQAEPQLRKKSAVEEDDFVQSALELFGGQLVQVKSAPPTAVAVAESSEDDDGELEDFIPDGEDDA